MLLYLSVILILNGAKGGTRTHMSKTLDPKSSAYTNFATLAKLLLNFKMVSHTGIEPVTP